MYFRANYSGVHLNLSSLMTDKIENIISWNMQIRTEFVNYFKKFTYMQFCIICKHSFAILF